MKNYEKKTLCELVEEDFHLEHFELYSVLVRKSKYVCQHCGRVARKKRNLCEAITLKTLKKP